MKHGNPCPKCGKTNPLELTGRRLKSGPADSWRDIAALPYRRYICCGCGYAEDWYDSASLQKILDRMEEESRDFGREF